MKNERTGKQFLQAMAGDPSHAWLLTGQGGGALAEQGAGALLCQEGEGAKPCGSCKACRMWAAGSHPDYRLLSLPEEGKAPSIKVEEVRALRDWLGQAPQYARKVLVIQGAERMTEAAQNALLRSLEEPPKNCFILLTGEEGGLLPTIRSRLNPLRLGGGESFSREMEGEAWSLLQRALGGDWALLPAAYMEKKGELRPFLEAQALLLRDLLAAILRGPLLQENSADPLRRKKLETLAGGASPQMIQGWLAATLEAQERLAWNANPSMTVDWLCIHMARRQRERE